MSSGASSQSDQNGGKQHATSGAERPASGQPAEDHVPAEMLSQIVAETASRLAPGEAADPALWRALAEVAQRLAGQPMTLEPAGIAVIDAVLRPQFPILTARPALWDRTCRTVAQSLLADPTARRRLEQLWTSLAEDAS